MDSLTAKNLGRACRIFMDLAYPHCAATIPAARRVYYDIAEDRPVEDYLPPAACTLGVCQSLAKKPGGLLGFEFRLGSASYPHLKLRVQHVDFHHDTVWVYSVDTHDGFHHAAQFLSPEEAEAWKQLVDGNRALKHRIERALAEAGFLTPTALLRIDLASAM